MNPPTSTSSSAEPSASRASLGLMLEKVKKAATSKMTLALETALELGMKATRIYDTVQEKREDHQKLLDNLMFVTSRVLGNVLPVSDHLSEEMSKVMTELKMYDACHCSSVEDIAKLKHSVVKDAEAAVKRNGSYGAASLATTASQSIERLNKMLEHGTLQLTAIRTMALSEELADMKLKVAGSDSVLVPADLPLVEKPPHPPIFFGRDELIRTIVSALLTHESCHIPLLGTGGIGKTTIAAAVINTVAVHQKYGENIYYVRCECLLSQEGIQLALAAALGVNREHGTRAKLMAALASRSFVLLILDGIEAAWLSEDRTGVEQFLSALAGVRGLSLIITMRGALRPDGVDWIPGFEPVPPLSLDASRAIWMQISGHTDERLADLLRGLDGLPLAINLMAHRGQNMSPTLLVDTYTRIKTSLLTRGQPTRLTSLQFSIELSLNSPSMKSAPNALRLLSLMCLLPDGIAMAKLDHMLPSMQCATEAALVLIEAALVLSEAEHLRVLSPIRDFVLEKYPPGEPELTDLRNAIMEITWNSDRIGTSRSKEAIALLSAQFGNIHTVILHFWKTIPDTSQINVLHRATDRLVWFSHAASYGDCVELLEAAAVAFENHDMPLGAAQCIQSLGNALLSMDRCSEAAGHLENAERAFKAQGNIRLGARCTYSLALLLRKEARYKNSLEKLQYARTKFELVHDRAGQAQCIQTAGEVLQCLHQHAAAIEKLDEAKACFEILGDMLSVAQCAQSIGNSLRLLSEPEKATAKFGQARDALEAAEERIGNPQYSKTKGNVLASLRQYTKALTKLDEAKGVFESIGDILGSAQCSQSISLIHATQFHFSEAREQMRIAGALYKDIGNRAGEAECMQSYSEQLLMTRNYTEALDTCQSAAQYFTALGERNRSAQCRWMAGDILCRLHHFEPALNNFKAAQEMFQELDNTKDLARCIHSTANVMWCLSRPREAVERLGMAKAMFESLQDPFGVALCHQSEFAHLLRENDFKSASRAFEMLKKNFKAVGKDHELAKCWQLMGEALLRNQLFGRALGQLEEARKAFEVEEHAPGIAQCMHSIGMAAIPQRRLECAASNFVYAGSVFRQIGDKSGEESCAMFCEVLDLIKAAPRRLECEAEQKIRGYILWHTERHLYAEADACRAVAAALEKLKLEATPSGSRTVAQLDELQARPIRAKTGWRWKIGSLRKKQGDAGGRGSR
ncbi:hypothetical protein CALCODRAFT_153190 [Calocera cornea HHB12733]|uniref:Novel STAND NTPase 1 domain-containing protein n=1 Tax=Calocera cornea HHB12733 TaxID=1353952 RepID=A0A165CN10_9BASI|nr:hypothetical protein CALCODRAFT_153190 [Calocera cornea HHB12733]